MDHEACRVLRELAEDLRSSLIELLEYQRTWPRVDRARVALTAYEAWRARQVPERDEVEE